MNTVALSFVTLSVVALCAGTALGWLLRGRLADRRLRRRQAFFGLPDNAESLLVVNRDSGAGPELTVVRHDVFALLELAAVVKECGAHAQLVPHDAAQQSFGGRTEFCVGGPGANRRLAAHLHSLLPGVRITVEPDAGPDRGAFRIGSERYRMDPGKEEYVLLARLTAGQGRAARPVFLFCGQRAVTNQAATRYLARHHEKLARKYDGGSFVLLLKVVNSAAYGADMVELVGDVTKAAQSAPQAKSLQAQAQPRHRAGS
ncbi:hypothetical protein [Streptomyces sp. MJP52]|uniref:hypothetical protein n=1 Tax=Streptomyces sp. MJP52 TaxID=2940555 RepID=UPI0024740553|nr:hypothetical protein [Streptomyces sp. MJP52]MDH6223806.1 hypothetical protein [Streptomyces sp. MJP52]